MFEDINANVNTIMNQLGLGLLFDTAQTLAWERGRDLPNDADYDMAADMVSRWQDKRQQLGLEKIK